MQDVKKITNNKKHFISFPNSFGFFDHSMLPHQMVSQDGFEWWLMKKYVFHQSMGYGFTWILVLIKVGCSLLLLLYYKNVLLTHFWQFFLFYSPLKTINVSWYFQEVQNGKICIKGLDWRWFVLWCIWQRQIPLFKFIKRQNCHHIESSRLICSANQLTGYYMMAILVFNELLQPGPWPTFSRTALPNVLSNTE